MCDNCNCEFKKSIELFKTSIDSYTAKSFTIWFYDNKNIKKIEECFDNDDNDEIEDIFRDYFKHDLFNNWVEGNYDYYAEEGKYIIKMIKAHHFIEMWVDCSDWFYCEYNINKKFKNEVDAVNTIAYWLFSLFFEEEYTDLFHKKVEELKQEHRENKDRQHRLSCGVCLEKKLIYTGCSTCNNNYLCKSCYERLEDNNECPFCRGSIIVTIDEPHYHSRVSEFDAEKKCLYLSQLRLVVKTI